MKVTVDIDPELHRAIEAEASRTGRTIPMIIDDALETWLDADQEREDVASAEVAIVEYSLIGGEPADAFLDTLPGGMQAVEDAGEA